MKYFDTHAHYYDERFFEECKDGAMPLISSLLSSDVSAIINVGTSPETCRAAIAQAQKYNTMYTALGIHPSDAQRITASLDAAVSDIELLIKDKKNKAVALGEIGLDYHYPDTDKALQMRYFEAQMTLAETLGVPVSIHDRDAHADVMEVIRRYPNVRGVFHSYSASPEMARELVKRGWYISFSGTLTFKNANRVRESARAVPKERLLIETDAPYLSPHPHRGKINHSGRLVHSLDALSTLWDCSPEEAAKQTFENAQNFFFG